MQYPVVALAFALAALVPAAASAQQPSSIGGLVYDCASGRPVGGASVTLRGLDDGSIVHLHADAKGRFAKVGLAPGRWQIDAASAGLTSFGSTREAVLETDDALAMRIGVRTFIHLSNVTTRMRGVPPVPHAACDPFHVPPAPSTTDRYIIH